MSSTNYSSPIDFRLSQRAPSDDKVAIEKLYESIQQIARGLVQYAGVGTFNRDFWPLLNDLGPSNLILSGQQDKVYLPCFHNMSPGRTVSMFNNAGTLTVQYANATDNTKPCDGFTSQNNLPTTLIGGIVEVILAKGVFNPTAGSVTIGQRYWLGTTSGFVQPTKPTASGNIEQYIGIGITVDDIYFNTQSWIQH